MVIFGPILTNAQILVAMYPHNIILKGHRKVMAHIHTKLTSIQQTHSIGKLNGHSLAGLFLDIYTYTIYI